MSYLMDYGDDWPPPPEPPRRTRRRWPLPAVCGLVIATYALIAVFGLTLLHFRDEHRTVFSPAPTTAAHTSHGSP